jgi:hypothetical protein
MRVMPERQATPKYRLLGSVEIFVIAGRTLSFARLHKR